MLNWRQRIELAISASVVVACLGCGHSRSHLASESVSQLSGSSVTDGAASAWRPHVASRHAGAVPARESARAATADSEIRLVSDEQPDPVPPADSEEPLPEADPVESPAETEPLQLDAVIDSVVASYPLLISTILGREIAQGELLAANGEFDLKLLASSLNAPLGFYQSYRQFLGADQPLYGGGSVFGGYRIGTGAFPSYYGDRETNLGGEFKAGAILPLARNRNIDDRRAELWRSQWEVQAVEPEIRAQLIELIRVASITYWNWLAAGQNQRIAEDLLRNATDRNEGLRIRVERGDAPAIELVDNERLIVSRSTKLIDARRKFQQSSYKLSLFLRDAAGQPRVMEAIHLPRNFPPAVDPAGHDLSADIAWATANRPELRALAILTEQLNIDLASAENLGRPQIDAVLIASQDMGDPADPKKNDKSPFEFEGGLVGSVPVQRRKARGKIAAVEGKLAQVRAKLQFTENKIVAEVQSVSAALTAAYQQLEQAHRSLELARQMEAAERRKFDLGDSNLLLVNLREQATADAASTEVEARLSYFDAQADYLAALGGDILP